MTAVAPYRSAVRPTRDRFSHLVRAEWTKFRTVRGWVITLSAAALTIILLGVMTATGNTMTCSKGPVEVPCPAAPTGPGGEAVTDRFYFVHRSLTGDGAITAHISSMSGRIRRPDPEGLIPGIVPWAKAGLMVKNGVRQGAAYAAVMVTAKHGVRMQHNFTEDTAGSAGALPRWLRLVRSGATLTGYESPDGAQWTKVSTVTLAGLPQTVEIGMFAASPGDLTVTQSVLGATSSAGRFAEVSAVFDQVGVQGGVSGGTWARDDVGVEMELDGKTPHHPGGLVQSGDTFTLTGVGDMAPAMEDGGVRVEFTLTGAVVGLIMVIVVAAMFVTVEYRRGLIRTTLLASPRRGRALVAKAVVIGLAAFAAGLIGAGVTVPLGKSIMLSKGTLVSPVSAFTEVRVIVGFAALLAAFAVLSLGLGALFRRSVVGVTAAIVLIVLPYTLATVSLLPTGASQWLTRITPAAGFAVLQSIPEYAHVLGPYAPATGYYPLPPWGGLAVACAYAGLALTLATLRLRRSDV
ncbi:ABC transporter permease subunit [Nonomuraea sp. NPDC050556]|uniref:ABC transporter permease subunit n=1 Tax=Nonomuraea sp. NPDC050556 TaxID=3364369 RepID=UPI00378CBDDF